MVRQWVAGVMLSLFIVATADAQAIHIVSGQYGVQGGNTCDATSALSQQCEGKQYCKVYVDDRQLCSHPFQGYKHASVKWSCNGKPQPEMGVPQTGFIELRCSSDDKAGGNTKPTAPVSQPQVTVQPGSIAKPPNAQGDSVTSIPGRVWRVTEGDPSWRGVWTRQGNSNTFDVVNTRTYGNEVQRFTVTMEVSGSKVTINRGGQFYNGTISADRKRAEGTANWYHPGTTWHAVID